jgi:glycerophosphoryl diester phosphodiesterase
MLVSPALLRAVHAAGGELWVWTVDDRPRVEELAALGVDAIITNDPRLFERAGPTIAGAA